MGEGHEPPQLAVVLGREGELGAKGEWFVGGMQRARRRRKGRGETVVVQQKENKLERKKSEGQASCGFLV